MTKLIIELDMNKMNEGFVAVSKVDQKGQRSGHMDLTSFADLMRSVLEWESSTRSVKLFSRFEENPYIAWGQNGTKWVAVKEIPPGEYFLTSTAGQAYRVKLPRLIAKVGNHSSPYLFWTAEKTVGLKTRIFPLVIGNIDYDGWVCLGTTGLKCKNPDDIERFIRQAIEAPSTGTYVWAKEGLAKFYERLTKRWNPKIGADRAITLEQLLARVETR